MMLNRAINTFCISPKITITKQYHNNNYKEGNNKSKKRKEEKKKRKDKEAKNDKEKQLNKSMNSEQISKCSRKKH